jgi:two-component system CheB/CheR fusion protein
MATSRSPHRAPSKQARDRRIDKKRATAKRESNFPVVAIGASAGGLEAFRALLLALPSKTGMAFILVQHLDPSHASGLVKLLTPHTAMTVAEAREGVRLEPNHVYIIPPGRFLALRNGAFHLSTPAAGAPVRMPFDVLLQSLAKAIGSRAVCIILSGTASDGSVGARAVKAVDGLVIAQDPQEAEFNGMPHSAIAAGVVDLVLPVAKMPEALAKYAGHRFVQAGKGHDAHAVTAEDVTKIVDLLRKKTPHDFGPYKTGTLARRIERRMTLAGIQDSDQYLELLTRDPAERQRLENDLLINVTRFFRDTGAFELIAKKVIPELVRSQAADRRIRIWVAGCSTGEEVYSIAMLFLEEIAAAQLSIKLQIFATDVHADAIDVAREGLYPPSIKADVPPALLNRFFTKEDQGYRVSADLRSVVAFSIHDLLADAPFSRLDFISCRNLLIYLSPETQRKVHSLFHFALRDGGILFLGTSESVGSATSRFEPIAKNQRIYRHIGHSRPGEMEPPHGQGLWPRWIRPVRPAGTHPTDVSDLMQRLLLETYAPASILVNSMRQGLYYYGPTDRYLKVPAGAANQDLLASARDGLRPAIRRALENAGKQPGQEISIATRMKRDGATVAVTIGARPVKSGDDALILLTFVEASEKISEPAVELPADAPRVSQLEQDLDITRRQLEMAIHDREIAEEETKAINEEAMSANEELQTSNEELEASKEELQSLNEELTVLNNQLQTSIDEHLAVANDMENILTSTLVATLFLDAKLNIRFFTPAAQSLFSIIGSDVGRPLSDLARRFSDTNLFTDAKLVLANLVPITREISAENGKWFTCRILPYRTKDNRIEGVVVIFVDVTARKQAEDALNSARLQAENANLGKSRFLAAASHDLRQPLQTLGLLQGVLATKLTDKDSLELLVLSEEALTAMSGMLNTLLDINQLEAGVIRPEIIDVPINDVLEQLKTEFAYHAQAHGLGLHVVPCHLTVRSDPRLLGQMIRNLLSNAVKYTKKGRILLGCRRSGKNLRIEVWDTGLGIPEGQLRAIFQEFHQVDNEGRERSRGLGLGLAIVQRLGNLLGHAVDVRSRVGRGSVFFIEAARGAETVSLAPREREHEKIPRRSGSILIVEDDPALRYSLDVLLRTEGHRTTAVSDGEEAMDLVARKEVQPDIVIIDYNLPRGLTGVEVLARLRAGMGHDLTAMVLTGDISTKTLRDIAREGYIHCGKPMRAEDLTQLVQSMLSGRWRAPSPKETPVPDAGLESTQQRAAS